MELPPIPNNEDERISALKSYRILDTDFDDKFDNLTQLARQICETEIALVSLIDENRQWFKSCVGLDAKQTSRGISFCGHAIYASEDVFEIQDAAEDIRFFDNPLVLGEPKIRFYAGAPIVDKDGFSLGTLCVIDSQPKKLNSLQKSSLKHLAAQVYHLIELHNSNHKTESERLKFKRFADLSPNILYRFSSDKSLIYYSPAIESVFGYSNKEFTENPNLWIELIHQDDVEMVKQTLLQAKKGERIDVKYRMKSKDKGWRWIHDISTSILLDGSDYVIEGVAVDFTDTLSYQQNLVELNNRYDTAMKASNDAIWQYNAQSDQLIVSTHFFEWLNIKPVDYQLKLEEFSAKLHQADHHKFQHFIDSLVELKFKKIDIDVRILIEKNNYKWFNLRGSIINEKEKIIAGSISEIHLRKINEQELLKAKSLLGQASKLAKLGAWEYDIETKNVNWSDETYEIHEIDEEQRNKFDLDEVIKFYSEEDWKLIQENIKEAVEKDKGYDLILEITTAKGNAKWIRTIARTDYSANERKRKVLGVIQDITAEVKLKEKQDRLLELTNNQNSRLKNFAYIVSHNLRSHAANFSSLLGLLGSEKEELLCNEIFLMLNKSSSNLLQTIEDLSKVAGIYQSEQIDFTKVNLNSVLTQVIENLTGLAQDKNIKISCNLGSDIFVKGLASYVESVLFNLLTNAIKYSDDSKEKWVKISLEETKKQAKITFEDNGLGINLQKHEKHLFQMYKVFHNHKDGRGLGLFITKNQIEAMGGSIEVNSTPGVGSKFVIHLKKYNKV